MELTPKNKEHIDSLTYTQLLRHWRFTPTGVDQWLEGATGKYWCTRMGQLKIANPDEAIAISKELGWSQ